MENQPFDEEYDSNYSVMLNSGVHVNVTARYAANYDNGTIVTFFDVDDNVVAHFNDVSYWMKVGFAQEVKDNQCSAQAIKAISGSAEWYFQQQCALQRLRDQVLPAQTVNSKESINRAKAWSEFMGKINQTTKGQGVAP